MDEKTINVCNYELTLPHLTAMEPNTVFLRGELPDSPLGIHMTGSGKMLRFVVVRGGIPDWAIYCHWAENDWDWIRRFGDKVPLRFVRRVVPCDDAALAVYRV